MLVERIAGALKHSWLETQPGSQGLSSSEKAERWDTLRTRLLETEPTNKRRVKHNTTVYPQNLCILTTLALDIQCESLLRMCQSVIWWNRYPDCNLKHYKEELLFPRIQRCATPDTKNGTKNHPLEVAKNVWKRIPDLMQQHKTPWKGFN